MEPVGIEPGHRVFDGGPRRRCATLAGWQRCCGTEGFARADPPGEREGTGPVAGSGRLPSTVCAGSAPPNGQDGAITPSPAAVMDRFSRGSHACRAA